jgi:hypothetical protein
MDEMKENPDGREDEVSLVDLLAVLVKKRRLWIGITLVGTFLGLVWGLSGIFDPKFHNPEKEYSATIKLFLSDFPGGDSMAALVTSESCLSLMAKDLDPESVDAYRRSATANFDPKTRFLFINARGKTVEGAKAEGLAASTAIGYLLDMSGFSRTKVLAEALGRQAKAYRDEANSVTDPIPPTDAMRLVAYTRSTRIEAEAYRDSWTMASNDQNYHILDKEISNCKDAEKIALNALQASQGSGVLAKRMEAGLALLVADLLDTRASFDKAMVAGPRPEAPTVVDVSVSQIPPLRYEFPMKRIILITLASLFIGILAAFCANAWDRIKADPEAMAKLKDAAKRR